MAADEVLETAPAEPGETASAAPGIPRGGTGGLTVLRVLRHREFAIFWSGLLVSMIGTWMQAFAQGLVVAKLSTSASALGWVNFAMSVPTLLLMPLGGVAADRWDRRKILIYAQWVMLALAVLTGYLLQSGRLELWHLYLIALVLGAATAYDLPAYQSFYPQLVAKEDLTQAISLNQATFHGSRIIGPALASAVVRAFGTAAAFYANAASFLAVIISLYFIRSRPPAAGGAPRSAGNMMREGVAYVRERPELQALLGITGVTTFFIFPNLAVLMPHYALHVLPVGEGGLGALMSFSGFGSLLGSLLLLNVPHGHRAAYISVAAGSIVAMLSLLAWAQTLWVAVAASAVLSLGIAFSVGLSSIMVQETVPDEMRGRVMSLYSLTFTGIMPFGALAIPKLADVVGMRWELQTSAALYAFGMLLLMVRLYRHYRDVKA